MTVPTPAELTGADRTIGASDLCSVKRLRHAPEVDDFGGSTSRCRELSSDGIERLRQAGIVHRVLTIAAIARIGVMEAIDIRRGVANPVSATIHVELDIEAVARGRKAPVDVRCLRRSAMLAQSTPVRPVGRIELRGLASYLTPALIEIPVDRRILLHTFDLRRPCCGRQT
jgi:hypothetical protein